MSWRDRPYAGGDDMFGEGGGMRVSLPPWTPVVKWLIIANSAVALLTIVFSYRQVILPEWVNAGARNATYALGALDLKYTILRGQLWRLLTYQYLHLNASHFLFNLLVLYFFGPPLERQFGRRTFLLFYTACGLGAAALYLLVSVALEWVFPARLSGWGPLLIGASGSILGCLAACAILFPRMIVLIFPIRPFTVFYLALFVLSVVWDNSLSDAAHLGGMVGAWAWIMIGRRFEGRMLGRGGDAGEGSSRQLRRSAGNWRKKQEELAREQEEVDRILAKVHEQGIGSLTRRERKALQRATERQRERDREKQRQLSEWNVR